MLSKTITSTIALMGLSSMVTAAPQNLARRSTSELSLTAQLQLADTAIDRYALLKDEDFVFNFTVSGPEQQMANRKTFPALVGTGGALAVNELGPCGMAALHLHPRSAELFLLVSGRVITEMVPEIGVLNANGTQRAIRTELSPNMMTVFPMGSLHMQMNPDCEPALTVTGFMDEDPSVGLVAPEQFSIPDAFIAAGFGNGIAGADIDRVRHLIPQGPAITIDECLKKCNIKKRQA